MTPVLFFLAILTVAFASLIAFRSPQPNQSEESPAVITLSPTLTPAATPSITPASTPAWDVRDTGKDSSPHEMEISHESENTHVKASVTTNASGNVEETANISVTVNGETREIKD